MTQQTQQQVSNNFLSRLFSGEIALVIAGGLITAGVLMGKVEGNASELEKQEIEIKDIGQAVSKMQTDIAVIKNNQVDFRRGLEKQNEAQKERQEETNRLLRELVNERR